MLRRASLLALVLAACGGKSPPPRPADPVADRAVKEPPSDPAQVEIVLEPVAAETPYTTPWGATITVAAGWYLGHDDLLVQVQSPEQDLTLTLTTVQGEDRAAAFAAAWKRVDPTFDLAIAQDFDVPGEEGWDAMGQTVYVTPASEDRVVVAFGRELAGVWHVALIDGAGAAMDRRGAQLNAVVFDMKVPGIEEESWADRTAKLEAGQLGEFDAFVEQAMAQAGVPGASIAIVHGGKIVFEKGYGKRGVGDKAKDVKPGTAFMIGSTSKSLTTLMMARLVDQGKLAWDGKVVDALPSFALGDETLTNAMTVQHTVCACTGMPRQDLEFIFEYGGWTPEQRIAAMAKMVPTTGFGETFQYSNSMVAVGGYVGAHVYAPKKKLGPAYDAAMQDLVFDPLGMKATTLDFKKAQKGDWAKPTSQDLDQEFQEFPVDYEQGVSSLRPAGGIWSTAHDLAQYVLLELAGGKTVKGKELVSTAALLHRRDPQVKIAEDDAYGLGLFVSDVHGVPVIHHGGNMLGYTSDLAFLPGADLGFVLLTNAGGANAFRSAVRGRLLELVYEGKPEAADALANSLAVQVQANAEQRALLAEPDDAWLQGVLGKWTNPSLGDLTISKGKTLVLDAGEWKSTFTKYDDKDGVPKLITTGPPYVGVVLRPDGDKLVLDAGQQTYELTRKAK